MSMLGPAPKPFQNKTLHVTGISPMVDETLLGEIFGAFGELISCRITQDAAGVHGYCDFADYTSASTALAALNGREVLGSQLGVAWHVQNSGQKEDTTGHITVFVGNIGDAIDEYSLFEAFAQYNCSDSRIIRGDDGRCLGYGFVTIRLQEDANAAVTAMDGQRLMGRPLRVSLARTPRLSEPTATAQRAPDPPASSDINVVAKQATDTNCTVHVGNLLGTESEETLRKAFEEFGTIDNIRVPGKNFGFVAYTTHMAAAAAIATKNGTTPPGFTRPVRCTWASERRNASAPAPGGPPPMAPPAGYGYGGPPGMPPPPMPPPGGHGDYGNYNYNYGPPMGGPPPPGYGYGMPPPPHPAPGGYDGGGGKMDRGRDSNRHDPYSR